MCGVEQDGDPGVAVVDKHLDRTVGLPLVVDGDGGERIRVEIAEVVRVGAAHEGNAERGDILARIVVAAAEHDEALETLCLHEVGSGEDLVVIGGDLVERHGVSALLAALLDGADDRREERIVGAAHHNADHVALGKHQVARGAVGDIVELTDSVEDLLAGIGAHIGMVVEHARDGAHGNIAMGCYVLDGCHRRSVCPPLRTE